MNMPEWANWLARDKDGGLYVFEKKPIKAGEAWHIKDDDDDYRIMSETDETFSHIKWEDEEPIKVKKMYEISVHGCDDSTIIKQELTLKEYELLKEIAEKITNTSSYGCMPTMGIRAVKNDRIEFWVDGENVATATDVKINKAEFSSPSGNVWNGFIVEQGD